MRLEKDGVVRFCAAYGLADRRHGIPNSVDTQFGIASRTKGFTSLTVMSTLRLAEWAVELVTQSPEQYWAMNRARLARRCPRCIVGTNQPP